MVDLFDEVDEALRTDRYRALVGRLAPWVTGLFALVLLGYLGFWGWTAYQDRNLTAASNAYQKGVDAIGQGDRIGAERAFETAAKSGAPAFKTLALIQEGDLKIETDQPQEAARLFDQAAQAAPNLVFGDLARLKAAQALLDTAPFPQLQTRLVPLTDAKRPYSIYAKEALAMAKLMAGKTTEARRDFQVLSLSLGAPDDMRQRCQLAIALIDAGEAPTAVAAARAAATLPPSPPLNVPALPSAAPAQGAQGQGAQDQAAGAQGGAPPSPAGASQ